MGRSWENWDVEGVAHLVEALWQNETENAYRDELAELVRTNAQIPSPFILEVGCGTGLVYEKLLSTFGGQLQYIGVDTSLNMLSLARHKFPDALFLYGDGNELVFK